MIVAESNVTRLDNPLPRVHGIGKRSTALELYETEMLGVLG